MNQSERRIYLIKELLRENRSYSNMEIPHSSQEQKAFLRGLMNIRMPGAISESFLKIQDEYLQNETAQKGVVDCENLPDLKKGISLWQGDITLLKCDAIVNAANSGMTGCYVPNHNCIDNCIHTFAGVQLRNACAQIMSKQGYDEPTGKAKITKGYNLPCKYVIHTVGPIIQGNVTPNDEKLLESCYNSALQLASENNLETIAFCCISTGVFHFPNERAGKIAVSTVENFMQKNTSVRKVIFNVFKDIDREIYEGLLR